MKTYTALSRGFTLIITTLLCLIAPLILKADIGKFDVIELSDGNSIIYISTYSIGKLKNHDLCYYNWDGNFEINIETLLHNNFINHDSIEIFTSIEKINLVDVDIIFEDYEPTLYILKGKLRIDHSSFFENFEIVDAYHGNTYGFTYTPSLSSIDNIWLNDYEIEKYFDFGDDGLCNMTLYGIKNNLSKIEILRLKLDINTLIKESNIDEFNGLLLNLRTQNIIMVGFCSC